MEMTIRYWKMESEQYSLTQESQLHPVLHILFDVNRRQSIRKFTLKAKILSEYDIILDTPAYSKLIIHIPITEDTINILTEIIPLELI